MGPDDVDLAASPAGHFITTIDGRITWANQTFSDWVSGSPSADLRGRGIESILTAGGRVYYENLVSALALGRPLRNVSLSIVGQDGSAIQLLASANVQDATGDSDDENPKQVLWACLNVTERRDQERELLVAQRRLGRLQNLSIALSVSESIPEIGAALLGQLVDGIKADAGRVLLVNDDLELEEVASKELNDSGGSGEDLSAKADKGFELLIPEEPIFAVASDVPRSAGHGATAVSPFARQTALLPLRGSDTAIGAVSLSVSRDQPYDDEEKKLLVAASEMCARAIDRTLLLLRHKRDAERNIGLSALFHQLEEVTTVAERARIIAGFLVPDYADYASVELSDTQPAPTAVRHRDTEMEPTLRRLRTEVEIEAIHPYSLAEGRSAVKTQFLPRIEPTSYAEYGLDPAQLSALEALGPVSYIGLPLIARGQVTGSLLLAFSSSDRHYSANELEYFERMADGCALSLENARLYEHERDVARQLQEALMPKVSITDPRVWIGTHYQPGNELNHVGGDWYDAFMLGSDRIGLCIGDVVGGGITAATTMSWLQSALRSYALEGGGVSETLEKLNRLTATLSDALASTVAYVEIDLDRQTLTYSSAGHLPPLIRYPDGRVTTLTGARNPVLGVAEGKIIDDTVELEPGSTVLLFTDGLIERRDQSIDEGLLALQDLVRESPHLVHNPELLAEQLDVFGNSDDVCVIALTTAV